MKKIHLSIAPENNKSENKRLRKKITFTLPFFAFSLSLPILIYFLFHWGVISSKPRYSQDLEKPVALVNTGKATGTAFLVGETRLLTAKHVLAGLKEGESVSLTFENVDPPIVTSARILWIDPKDEPEPNYYLNDVAVLEIENPADIPEEFPRIILGNDDDVEVRSRVIAIGYPTGLASTTSGIISNDEVKGVQLFQLDIGAWQGSSGGPVVSEDLEEVVGILVAGLQGDYQGINFANKINNVVTLLNEAGIDIYE